MIERGGYLRSVECWVERDLACDKLINHDWFSDELVELLYCYNMMVYRREGIAEGNMNARMGI